MSTDEDDKSESWLRRRKKIAEMIKFYGKTLRNFLIIAKNPKESWQKTRKSRIARNLVLALLVSELAGLGIILVLMTLFGLLGYSKQTAVLTAIGIAHYVLDAPFDFWLWPRSCKRLYPKKRWKSMFIADMGYFYLMGKVVDWLPLVLKGVLAIILLSCAVPDSLAAIVSHCAQAPLYILLYTVFCLPLVLAREDELRALSCRAISRLKRAAARTLNPHTVSKSIFMAEPAGGCILDFSIQGRAGPRLAFI